MPLVSNVYGSTTSGQKLSKKKLKEQLAKLYRIERKRRDKQLANVQRNQELSDPAARSENVRTLSLEYAKRAEASTLSERFGSSYKLYLACPEWKAFRAKVLAERGAKCEDCGSGYRIQLHHLTYTRLYRELPEDVRVLCRLCHKQRHGLAKKNGCCGLGSKNHQPGTAGFVRMRGD